jgi:hypothetical protein
VDRLDRSIDVALFERKSAEYRQQQARISPRSKDRRGQRAVHGSWHQPTRTHAKLHQAVPKSSKRPKNGSNENWLPGMDSNHELDRF